MRVHDECQHCMSPMTENGTIPTAEYGSYYQVSEDEVVACTECKTPHSCHWDCDGDCGILTLSRISGPCMGRSYAEGGYRV